MTVSGKFQVGLKEIVAVKTPWKNLDWDDLQKFKLRFYRTNPTIT